MVVVSFEIFWISVGVTTDACPNEAPQRCTISILDPETPGIDTTELSEAMDQHEPEYELETLSQPNSEYILQDQ